MFIAPDTDIIEKGFNLLSLHVFKKKPPVVPIL